MELTGKDLILLILNYNLLDKTITKIDLSDMFLTVEEAAIKLGISTTSLTDMIKLGLVEHITVKDTILLSKDIDVSKIKRRRYE